MNAKQRLDDLLAKLEHDSFFGMETTNDSTEIDIHYSPSYMKVIIDEDRFGEESSIEIETDQNYNITTLFETKDGYPYHWTENEVKNRKGFIENYMLHDPRYVLHCAKNIKEVKEDVYRVEIINAASQELKNIMGVTMYADIHMIDNEIMEMHIIKQFKSKKEQLIREIAF